jgi:leucyl aminopeptidase (aminopeptidase T)
MRSELVPIVATIYAEMANLQPGTDVLVIADSRTDYDIVELFVGQARAFGATAQALIVPTPPSASIQPSIGWSKTVVAASTTPDLIVDLSVGYAQFMVDAVRRGARIISPGDGTGHENLGEVLLRTVGRVDIHALRREADQIASRFTRARECHVTSEAGMDLHINLDGLHGDPGDGFLWDPDRGDWKGTWALVPPAQPGVLALRGRSSGWIVADGFVLWLPDDIEFPRTPVRLHVTDGYIDEVAGDAWHAPRLRNWLREMDTAGDRSPFHGPVHANIGTNPQAKLSQHLEFERLRGTITFGFGDDAMLTQLTKTAGSGVSSPVHWDVMALLPTVTLDGAAIVTAGIISDEI